MKCIFCSHTETKVVDSRESEDITRRRRECLKCEKRFTTYERAESLQIYIIKKDNRRELFDREKLKKGILRACEKLPIPLEKIDNIVNKVESKLRTLDANEIQSKSLGEEVGKYLKQQHRWKRGFYRECLYTTTYAWKKSKIFYMENLVWMLFAPLFNLTSILVHTYLIIFQPMIFLTIVLPIIVAISICRDSLFFVNHPIKGLFYLPYTLFYAWVIYPLNIITVFQSSPEKWGTR